ncbi:DNA polymerase III subunit gamma/tau [Candidatus Poribacteria bacterium]|nr:DNA polymerase III subunit gamma/tau [Candidatus Poribacteria bacterium]
MSYEVFAQKWRPQFFRDVVGQVHVTTTIQNQIKSNRLGHAYLFRGPRGTGKTTVARLFAKAVNCLKPTQETDFDQSITGEPCNTCDACNQITQGSSFDVIEMDAASNRGIDTIRDLRENVKLSPAAYKYKVYIIDEVHMLTPEGFNALLKTLEEPPSHVIFIMATTEHSKIPKTIVSRCQDFDFRNLSSEQIISRLQLIASDEGISADKKVLSLIARQSEGCLRDAENLLERLVSSNAKELTIENVEETLGLGSSFLLNELSESIIKQNLTSGLQTLNKLSRQGMDLVLCLNQLTSYFRDLRLLAIDNQLGELIQAPSSELPTLKDKAQEISVERLSRIIRILMHANRDIKEYGYVQLQLESALVQINAIKEGIKLDEIVNKLIEVEQKIGSIETTSQSRHADIEGSQPIRQNGVEQGMTEPSISQIHETLVTQSEEIHVSDRSVDSPPKKSIPETKQKPNPEIKPKAINTVESSPDELSDIWNEVKSRLPVMLNHGVFQNAVPSFDGKDHVRISCPLGKFSIADEDARKEITKIFSEVIGRQVSIELIKTEIVPKTVETLEPSDVEVKTTPSMRKRQAEKDEQIRPILEMFDARILETK